MSEKISGIYEIVNKKNGKRYIGQAVDFDKRNGEHFRALEGGYHYNQYLQRSYNKYGRDAFDFNVLEYCDKQSLTQREQHFVDIHDPEKLYNVRLECVDSNLGMVHSEKSRKKMSKAHLGKTMSEESRKKMSEKRSGKNNPNYGKPCSEETRKKISRANSGENNHNWGKTFSKETRKKMSENQVDFSGKNNPMYGKFPSEETRKKMSKAQSGENNRMSKLTEKQVYEILSLCVFQKMSQTEVAKRFPVNRTAINRIVQGKRWKYCHKKFMDEHNQRG